MQLTLLVTTYERPDALARVLHSVAGQSAAPDELVVADDGSGEATRRVVAQFARTVPFPVIHSWQPDEGFRVCRSRNLALARAGGDYIVQVDGDMLLHPRFLADHRRAAQPGWFVQGTRILLSETATCAALAGSARTWGPFSIGIGGLRRLYALHSPILSASCARLANAFVAVKGCNMGYWLADALRVNGYDESMTGWGSEDKEFASRLGNTGVRRRTLIFGAIAWHLHHSPAPRANHDSNRATLARTKRERRVRCPDGIVRETAARSAST